MKSNESKSTKNMRKQLFVTKNKDYNETSDKKKCIVKIVINSMELTMIKSKDQFTGTALVKFGQSFQVVRFKKFINPKVTGMLNHYELPQCGSVLCDFIDNHEKKQTQKSTQKFPEKSTQKFTQKSTQNSTQKSTQNSTPKSTQNSTQNSTPKSTETEAKIRVYSVPEDTNFDGVPKNFQDFATIHKTTKLGVFLVSIKRLETLKLINLCPSKIFNGVNEFRLNIYCTTPSYAPRAFMGYSSSLDEPPNVKKFYQRTNYTKPSDKNQSPISLPKAGNFNAAEQTARQIQRIKDKRVASNKRLEELVHILEFLIYHLYYSFGKSGHFGHEMNILNNAIHSFTCGNIKKEAFIDYKDDVLHLNTCPARLMLIYTCLFECIVTAKQLLSSTSDFLFYCRKYTLTTFNNETRKICYKSEFPCSSDSFSPSALNSSKVIIDILPHEDNFQFLYISNVKILFSNLRICIIQPYNFLEILPINNFRYITYEKGVLRLYFQHFTIIELNVIPTDIVLQEVFHAGKFLEEYLQITYRSSVPTTAQIYNFKISYSDIIEKIRRDLDDEFFSMGLTTPIWNVASIAKPYFGLHDFTIHYLPDNIISKILKDDSVLEERHPRRLSSLTYRNFFGSVIIRRGYVEKKAQTVRLMEEHITTETLKQSRIFSKAMIRPEDKIVRACDVFKKPILFYAVKSDQDMADFDAIIKKLYKVIPVYMDVTDKRMSIDPFSRWSTADSNFSKSIYPIISKYIDTSFHIAFLMNMNTEVIIEDNKKVEITYWLCSLSKMFCSVYYTTLKGFIFLIKRDWVNYGYDFKLHFFSGKNIDRLFRDSSFVFFLITVRCLIYYFPKYFEFKINLIDSLLCHCWSCFYPPLAKPCFYDSLPFPDFSLFEEYIKNEKLYTNTKYNNKLMVIKIMSRYEVANLGLKIRGSAITEDQFIDFFNYSLIKIVRVKSVNINNEKPFPVDKITDILYLNSQPTIGFDGLTYH